MYNPFKINKKLKEIKNLTASITILETLANKGLLQWQPKEKALLIEQSLAMVELAKGAEGFRNFLNKVCQWQNYNLFNEAYDAYRINEEAKAVREAKKKHATLTPADINRIRQNARDNMQPLSDDKISSIAIQEFDIYIIRASAPSASEAIASVSANKSPESNAQLVAVGHYDGKHLEMALYDDIKHNLTTKDQ